MSRFYTVAEETTLRFYQMPKTLFNNSRYKGLSLGAKATYSILRDRQDLSIKNNYIDEDGNIYLLFKIEPAKDDKREVEEKEDRELSLMELLEVDRKTVMKYKKELVTYELIVDKRMGLGKTNRIYVLKPEIPGGLSSESVEIYKKSKKGTSGSTEKGLQEVQKKDGNETDFSETDFSETIIPSQKLSTEEKENSNESRKENERVKENTTPNEFTAILKQSGYDDFEEEYSTAIEQSIRILYYSDKPLAINGMRVPCGQVREDLQRLRWEHIDLALRDFTIASEHQQINNVTAYLSRCIYNAIFTSSLKVEADLRYNGLI